MKSLIIIGTEKFEVDLLSYEISTNKYNNYDSVFIFDIGTPEVKEIAEGVSTPSTTPFSEDKSEFPLTDDFVAVLNKLRIDHHIEFTSIPYGQGTQVLLSTKPLDSNVDSVHKSVEDLVLQERNFQTLYKLSTDGPTSVVLSGTSQFFLQEKLTIKKREAEATLVEASNG